VTDPNKPTVHYLCATTKDPAQASAIHKQFKDSSVLITKGGADFTIAWKLTDYKDYQVSWNFTNLNSLACKARENLLPPGHYLCVATKDPQQARDIHMQQKDSVLLTWKGDEFLIAWKLPENKDLSVSANFINLQGVGVKSFENLIP